MGQSKYTEYFRNINPILNLIFVLLISSSSNGKIDVIFEKILSLFVFQQHIKNKKYYNTLIKSHDYRTNTILL